MKAINITRRDLDRITVYAVQQHVNVTAAGVNPPLLRLGFKNTTLRT